MSMLGPVVMILLLVECVTSAAWVAERFHLGGALASSGMPGDPSEEECVSGITRALPLVQIQFGDFVNELAPGVSLITPDGALVNNGFPAISSNLDSIAVINHAPNPGNESYPDISIYSVSSFALQERVEFAAEPPAPLETSELADPEGVEHVASRIQEINRILHQDAFRSLPLLFRFPLNSPNESVERCGIKVSYDEDDYSGRLTVALQGDQREGLEVRMPVIPVIHGSDDPYNDCSVAAYPSEGWYVMEAEVMIIRLVYSSARADCDQPDQWLLKRLGEK